MDKKHNLPSLSLVRKTLYADWALQVKQRDGWKCLLCGCEENLTAHHWYCSDHHSHAARYCVDNGATLCYACHIRSVHTRADYVTVSKVMAAVGAVDTMTINAMINTELTTSTLRGMWDAMRERTLNCEGYSTCVKYKAGKLFFTVKHKRPIAVVGNVLRLGGWGLQEVAVVAPTEDGFFRYTLRRIKEQ